MGLVRSLPRHTLTNLFFHVVSQVVARIAGTQINWKNKKAVPHRTERRFSARPTLHWLGRKGLAAATTLAGVGIGYLETSGGEAVTEINDRAPQILGAERIDHNIDT